MADRPQPERRRGVEISGAQVIASALAAVSGAFLLSTLGAAGTVAGAAVTSVVATVGSALYVHVLQRTRDQLRDVRAQFAPRPVDRGAAAETVVLPVPGAEPDALGAASPPGPPGGTPQAGAPRRARVWVVRSALAAVVVFVVAMAGVTAIEAVTGRSFPSVFGHDDRAPSITQIGGSSGGGGGERPAPVSPEPTSTTVPSAPAPSESAERLPSASPSGGTGGDATAPAASPEPTRTTAPAPEPTPTGGGTAPTGDPGTGGGTGGSGSAGGGTGTGTDAGTGGAPGPAATG